MASKTKQTIQSALTKGCQRQGQKDLLRIQFTLTEINNTGIDST